MRKNWKNFFKCLIIFFCIFGLSLALYHNIINVSVDKCSVTKQSSDEYSLNTSVSEALVKIWNISWGGVTNDGANGLTLDSAGNIYVVGDTDSYGVGTPAYSNIFLIKYLPNGAKAWNITWGGTADEKAGDVQLDSAGNIYITGVTYSFGPGAPSQPNLVLLKYYSNGTKAWNVTWGGSASMEGGLSITLDSNGKIYVTGYTNILGGGLPDLALLKFFPNSTLIWNVTWGNSLLDVGRKVALDLAGKLYVVGASQNPHDTDLVLVKFDPNGTRIWNVTWGGSAADGGFSLTVDSAENIYTVGQTNSFSPDSFSNLALVKFSSNGTRLWNISWGGAGDQGGAGIAQDPANDLYTCGWDDPPTSSSELLLVKFTPAGNQLGNTTWGGGAIPARGMDIAINSSESIFVCGSIGIDGVMIPLNMTLGKFTFNKIPAAPSNPLPLNGAIGVSTNPLLSVYVTDPDNQLLTVSFYNATSNNLIGTVINIANGSRASTSWLGLNGRKTYRWYAITSDGNSTVRSRTWNFTTNNPPNFPILPLPINGGTISGLTTTLQVYVSDPDGDLLDVSFYNAPDNSLIGTATNVISGTNASTSWGGLIWGMHHVWYVTVTDGTNTTQSMNWTFTPNRPPDSPINPSPASGSMKMGNSTILTVYVSDPDGGALNVSFYNASSDTLIGTALNVLSGNNASIVWSPLAWGSRYYWYAIANDGFTESRSIGQWSFWTNFAPYLKWEVCFNGYCNPPDTTEFSGIPGNVGLQVRIGDDDGWYVNVSYYNAADNSLIGRIINHPCPQTFATLEWEPSGGFCEGCYYSWYIVISDGQATTVSPIWTFSFAKAGVPGWSILIVVPPIILMSIIFYLRLKRRNEKNLLKLLISSFIPFF